MSADPAPLILSVLDEEFTVPVIWTPKGTFWWVFVGEDGEPSRHGIQIKPLAEILPAEATIDGTTYSWEPVPKWDSESSSETTEFIDFDKTRRLHLLVPIDGFTTEVRSRITIRRNKNWNLSFRAWRKNESSTTRTVKAESDTESSNHEWTVTAVEKI